MTPLAQIFLAIGAVGALLASPALAAPKAQHPAERVEYSREEAASARLDGFPASIRFSADSPSDYDAWAAASPGASTDWLALSGGGEDGAFAAGLLEGWGESGRRPEFGVVTGVSTGAMIAPFAFVGAKYDRQLRETYSNITAADVFEFGGDGSALTDTWPLKKLVERVVTPEFLADVAAAHQAGRRLLVVTTNVDTQRPVAWDLGAVATVGGPQALTLFRQVILASAAIPGLFPPVLVKAHAGEKRIDEMHVDGGTMSPFYVAPGRMLINGEGHFPGRSVTVIVNGRLTPDFDVTEPTTMSVLGRAMSAAIRAQTAGAIALHRAFAGRTGLDLEVALIDGRFTRTSPGPFDQDYMRALLAHGEAVGRAGTAFLPRSAAPEGASSAETLATQTLPAHEQRRADAR